MTGINPQSKSEQKFCCHCGETCDNAIRDQGEYFCCHGCKQVYLLINGSKLCTYYSLEKTPGIKAKGKFKSNRFEYLDDKTVISKLVQFSNETQSNITFNLPQVYCSSCVYLLENLHSIEPGIIASIVNFQKKKVFISFNQSLVSLRKVVELLAFIGYEPSINLSNLHSSEEKAGIKVQQSPYKRKQLYRIGVAGFCFANIMMLSFPEYLSNGDVEESLRRSFTTLSLILSLPVLFFSAGDIFVSAWKGIRRLYVNIDVPIAFALIITFGRSYYEILYGQGAGYLDSGCGIVFFMLIGRWFQSKTYDALSFDRDYKSYFPLGVSVLTAEGKSGQIVKEKSIPISQLKKGDHIIVRNEELIPADAVLLKGLANIDYSFVNGEYKAVTKNAGDLIYAGGKQIGTAIELLVSQEASQSYITQLWNNKIFSKEKKQPHSFIHPWSRYFTIVLFTIATCTLLFWAFVNPVKIFPAVTAILIVACPCSLLLSDTFTNGNMMRIFGKNKFYLKSADIIGALASIDTIVFDKTGTLTEPYSASLNYEGIPLSSQEKSILKKFANQSSHPLSRLIGAQLQSGEINPIITQFHEYPGMGISAVVSDVPLKIGSAAFLGMNDVDTASENIGTQVHVRIGDVIKGKFSIGNHYRNDIKKDIRTLNNMGYHLFLLSGDNDLEMKDLRLIFGETATMKFRQMPLDKLTYISKLQADNKKVLMIGDGLNDAGALMQADVGIAVNNNNAQFSPACDAILDGVEINKMSKFLKYAKNGKKIITASFALSIVYNVVGIAFAASAHLSPMVAAILMPASSISVVIFVTVAGNLVAKRAGL